MFGSRQATGLYAAIVSCGADWLLIPADNAAGMVDGDVIGIITQKATFLSRWSETAVGLLRKEGPLHESAPSRPFLMDSLVRCPISCDAQDRRKHRRTPRKSCGDSRQASRARMGITCAASPFTMAASLSAHMSRASRFSLSKLYWT